MLVFALTIDDSLIGWIAGGIASGVAVASPIIVWLWNKMIGFFRPLITVFFASHNKAFEAQTALANEMRTQVPIVSDTLQKLGDTQEKQCQTLEQHGQMLAGHGQILNEHGKILMEIRQAK